MPVKNGMSGTNPRSRTGRSLPRFASDEDSAETGGLVEEAPPLQGEAVVRGYDNGSLELAACMVGHANEPKAAAPPASGSPQSAARTPARRPEKAGARPSPRPQVEAAMAALRRMMLGGGLLRPIDPGHQKVGI
jgi:hypothetical protein